MVFLLGGVKPSVLLAQVDKAMNINWITKWIAEKMAEMFHYKIEHDRNNPKTTIL